jgi:hypothetical protein
MIITHSLTKGELRGREELQMADNKCDAASAASSAILLAMRLCGWLNLRLNTVIAVGKIRLAALSKFLKTENMPLQIDLGGFNAKRSSGHN